ncbi:hypothetical protein [Vallitalea guaymasensis]|uniref:hypothetical protein n=1 Tax=Vallitalea guaymasensis TaxID=1185412 RepID=UPI00272B936E|nr:hypothetical protein [Vallitalea guaymasensis]
MKCFFHPSRDGQYKCAVCGKIICAECTCFDGNKSLCKNCYESMKATNINYGYNRFWAFVFSLIPGAGRMYLGFMEQGLFMMAIFFGIIAVSSMMFYSSLLPIVLLVVWFYSFFDTYHLKKKIDNNEVIIDKPIFNFKIKKSYTAYGMIVLGSVILINELIVKLYIHRLTYAQRRAIGSITMPLILIIIGLILLKQVKKSVGVNGTDDTRTEYEEEIRYNDRYDNVDSSIVENDITVENEGMEPEIKKSIVKNDFEIENEIEIEN